MSNRQTDLERVEQSLTEQLARVARGDLPDGDEWVQEALRILTSAADTPVDSAQRDRIQRISQLYQKLHLSLTAEKENVSRQLRQASDETKSLRAYKAYATQSSPVSSPPATDANVGG